VLEQPGKAAACGESCRAGNSVSQLARQHGVSASQLIGWQRQAMAKRLITYRRLEPSGARKVNVHASRGREGAVATGCGR